MYALWKSWKVPNTQGRLVLRQSKIIPEDQESEKIEQPGPGVPSRSRGWWDYVPEEQAVSQPQQEDPNKIDSWILTEDQGFFRNTLLCFRSSRAQHLPTNRSKNPTIAVQEEPTGRIQRSDSKFSFRSPLSPSIRLSHLMKTRMALFREVMKTEVSPSLSRSYI